MNLWMDDHQSAMLDRMFDGAMGGTIPMPWLGTTTGNGRRGKLFFASSRFFCLAVFFI